MRFQIPSFILLKFHSGKVPCSRWFLRCDAVSLSVRIPPPTVSHIPGLSHCVLKAITQSTHTHQDENCCFQKQKNMQYDRRGRINHKELCLITARQGCIDIIIAGIRHKLLQHYSRKRQWPTNNSNTKRLKDSDGLEKGSSVSAPVFQSILSFTDINMGLLS